MAIRLDGVVVLCDATCKSCEHRCTAETSAALVDGQLRVLVPPSWTQSGDILIGPNCSEERALEKAHQAEVPDLENDPPAVKAMRETQLEYMRELVKAEIEGRKAEFPELREYVKQLTLEDEDVPDFLGHVGSPFVWVGVRVRGSYVEISFDAGADPIVKGGQGPAMSLVLKHENLRLVDPPAFVDPDIIAWVQSCLHTMTSEEVSGEDVPVLQ